MSEPATMPVVTAMLPATQQHLQPLPADREHGGGLPGTRRDQQQAS
jgi:hypothetical protein